MKKFPAFCIDDFYENPDEIRELALSANYLKSDGIRPGLTSEPLHETHPELFNHFCKKLFSIFYDIENTKMEWLLLTFFQYTECLDPDPLSPKNIPWIHDDGLDLAAGVIYLNKNPKENSGTSIYNLKKGRSWKEFTSKCDKVKDQPRFKFFRNGIYDEKEYSNRLKENYEIFEETVRFENRYNRLVCYDSNEYHAAQSYYCDEPRLTQVFFMKELKSEVTYPLLRYPKIKLGE